MSELLKKKKTILLDLDDVITDFLPQTVKKYNEIHNTNIPLTAITEWKICNKTFEHGLFEVFNQSDLLENMPLKNKAFEIITQWYNQGHDIVIVTASDFEQFIKKRKWLINSSLFPFVKDMIMTENKYLINGDILVDDRLENLIQWKTQHPNGIAILMNAVHNRNLDSPFSRVDNWQELVEYFESNNIL